MKIPSLVAPLIDAVVGRLPENVRFVERTGRIVDRDWYLECADERAVRLTLDTVTLKNIG